MRIAILGAVVAGSVGGSLAALVVPRGAPPPEPAAPPATAPPVAAPAPTAPPDPRAALGSTMEAVLTRFTAWARDHAGEPCPDVAALGIDGRDPWGRPLQLTCTDQPADQRIGAISPGPDGIAGTDDDLASWNLGRPITELVRGARWPVGPTTRPATRPHSAGPSTGAPPPHARRPAPPTPTADPAPVLTPPVDAAGDDIPARR
jgi:hypothetical protein